MNLRHAGDYSIGIDLGTGSVGWAVVDDEGKLCHVKGKPAWGARLFPSADTAAATRVHRGQRRRYDRRRQRIDYLQAFFMEEMESIDSEFFVRLNQSRLWAEDRNPSYDTEYRWPLFNGVPFTEAEYYKEYPTIYHLRQHLMQSDEKADIRLVYLALHNIVKYRGNFLHEDEGSSLKAANANAESSVSMLVSALDEYVDVMRDTWGLEDVDCSFAPDVKQISAALDDSKNSRAQRAEDIQKALGANGKQAGVAAKCMARACVGYKVEFANLLVGIEKGTATNFQLSSEEKVEEFLEMCPDEAQPLFAALQACYSAYVLADILKGHQGISEAMVASYEQHQSDLRVLKDLVRQYLGPKAYNSLFRGPKDERGEYDINKLPKGSYTAYIAGEKLANSKGCSHEDLIKRVRELCKSSEELQQDERYLAIKDRLEAEDTDFLKKQKTRDNGAIPYQLHLEEMEAIITRQGRYYPFLAEHRDELEKIVSSRIPYYVGPLNAGHRDPKGNYPSNPIDPARRFGWSVRREGMETVPLRPWNVEEVIDTDQTAERFIQRMTGTCTYLLGEPVLPRRSLLYEEFCVLNELNGVRWARKGEKPHRFDARDRAGIMRDLFMRSGRASVTYQDVKDWLCQKHGDANVEVTGAQAENGFESKLATLHDFYKLFGVRDLDDASLSYAAMEEIVLWSTVFEDRGILKRKLVEKYGQENGGPLTSKQIKSLVNKRYAGWGRLSRKLLAEVRVPAPVPTSTRGVTVIDVLRDGNPFDGYRTLNFMELLNNDDLGFQRRIDELNNQRLESEGRSLSIDDLQGSPANRRAVNQAMKVIAELVHIAGHAPKRICIEVTRDDDQRKKGKRTNSRYKQLAQAVSCCKQEFAETYKELKRHDPKELDDDRLYLYLQQGGKCMYSGDSIDINQLHTGAYHIDHIIPQSYIKDDSISNRVLVKASYNERKLNGLIPDEIVAARRAWWIQLQRCGLISEKKLRNLTRRSFSDGEMKGFISRQLVETSQVVKFVRLMCEEKYGPQGTEVVSVRANVSHGVRDNLGLVKCRELNDFHHAHDAFLACQVADFTARCYPNWQDGQKLQRIRKYVEQLLGEGRGKSLGNSGFIADGLTRRDYFDEGTGEIVWDHGERDTYVCKALGYKDCYISRMTEEQTGAFWDETVYSPRDTKNGKALKMPLKSGERSPEGYLDPKKYGGVSSVKQAYWFIFAAKDKKGRWKYFFEGVPIHLAETISGDGCDCKVSPALQEYANSIAAESECGEAVVLRKKVPARQKLAIDGTQYYLYGGGGSNELRAARQLCASQQITQDVAWLFAGKELSASTNRALWDWVRAQSEVIWPWMVNQFKLDERYPIYEALTLEEQGQVLRALITKANGTAQKIDMTLLGGSKTEGNMRRSIATLLPEITWIDQSVTGIFERRTTFKDLTRGL